MVSRPMIDLAAFYAQEAYREKLPDSFKIQKGATVCYVTRMPSMDVFAFRGSDDLLDWTLNATALPVPSGGGWCHAGFVASYRAIKDEVQKFLRPFRMTLVTGHSRGAAIAERFVMDLQFMKELHMVTFGKPNLRFKPQKALLRHLKTQLSVVNGSDIVARVPKYLFGPDPGQDVLYFPNEGEPILERYSLARAVMREDWRPSDTASDHSMNKYRENVRSWI